MLTTAIPDCSSTVEVVLSAIGHHINSSASC